MRAHLYTLTATVATLVAWQVKKVNSLVCPFRFFIVDKYDVYILYEQLQVSRTANKALTARIYFVNNHFEATDRS